MASTTARTLFSLASALGLAALSGCGASHMVDPDAGGPITDSSLPIADAGSPFADAGSPIADSGRPVACAPLTVATVGDGCFCDGPMARAGSVVYRGAFEMEVIDWTERAAPRLLATHTLEGRVANDMEVEGSLLFVSGDFDRDLAIYDVSVPSEPMLLFAGTGRAPERVVGLDAVGDQLLVGSSQTEEGFVRLYDLRSPEMPDLLLEIPTIPGVDDVALGEGILVATAPGLFTDPDRLLIFDARDGRELARVELSTRSFRRPVAVEGGYLFLLGGEIFEVFDVREPSAPRVVATLPLASFGTALLVEGGLAYVGDAGALRIADLSDPRAPRWIGGSEAGSDIGSIVSGGTHAMVSGGSGARVLELTCSELAP